MTHRLIRALRRFSKAERGSATLEFCILLPGFILIFLSTFELGMLMTRHVMLDRALDLAVREVRLGALTDADHQDLVDAICEHVLVMDTCTTELKLEMRRVDPWTGLAIAPVADCANRDEPGTPPANFANGGQNQLMVLRACALFDPMFPTTGLGASLPRESGGAYALVATSSYVIEPF
ncbi:TadE/TadG family type IV pilus assembly protein [Wenxinia marina]|uniref:TadE-like protein n=1 Tax=Wenxinia marina DSM 24838 TaxID=1123501 RepID=A0A0D0Q1A0_9RHOB|nr:TadE/TadG family type IV pilus assembly protein [Wenxinia marina]KIQ68354.1 TadE-like protein [Wenxinia marina DSM 24838]GGL72868.1 hypothetical protein GCM10011392_29350 [Wenxinia marina]